MTDMDTDDIDERVQRIETIITELESGEPSLSEGQALLEEGRELLTELEAELDAGDGAIIDLDDQD